jgi:hypothetical protein
MKKFFLFISLIVFSNRANDFFWNIYDPDSLVVISLLDSNNFPHEIFQDVIWVVIKENPNDSDCRVTSLYLKRNALPGPIFCIPPEIKNLNKLTNLLIANHELQHLPVEIKEMEWMQGLDLRYNPLKKIPAELAQCFMLYYLGLSHTDITSMPDEFLDLDSMRPCNISVDTINGNIYPRNVIDLCGLENFTLTERQKAWAGVTDYEEYKLKYCQETAVKEHEVHIKTPVTAGIHAVVTGYILRLTLAREGVVSLSLFNSSGRRVYRLVQRKLLSKCCHSIPLNKNIPPGVYFLRGEIGGVGFSRRVVVTGGI